MRGPKRAGLLHFIVIAPLALGGCGGSDNFTGPDQARGTALAAGRVLALGPICAEKLPHLKFDLDRARDEQAASIAFLKSHGETDSQIAELKPSADTQVQLETVGDYPEVVIAMCNRLWDQPATQHFKQVGFGYSKDRPADLSRAAIEASSAEAEAASAKADAASKEADAAAAEANNAMEAATSAMNQSRRQHR